MNDKYFIKGMFLLLLCICLFYLMRNTFSIGKAELTDNDLQIMDDSLIAQSVPKSLKYIKYIGSCLCVVRDTVKKENWLYQINGEDKGRMMLLYDWHLDSIPGTREYLFLQRYSERYFLNVKTLKRSAAICFGDFNMEHGLGQSRNGFLALGYSKAGRFRYLVSSEGAGCYLWGIDKVQACNGQLQFSLGIKPYSFSMDRPLADIDSVYVPYPVDTKLIQGKYTVDREGETHVRLCINLTYPTGTLAKNRWLKDWISSMINHCVTPWVDDSKNYHGDNPIALCDRYYQYYGDFYNEECPWSDREIWFHWEKQVLLSLQWKSTDNRYVTFYIVDDGYYGGVHGIYTREYVTLDLQNEKVLTFNDLIKPEKRRYVRNILLKKMKADYNRNYEPVTDAEYLLHLSLEDEIRSRFKDIESKEAVRYMKDHFPLNEPAVTPEGLVFYYAPYEIDSFAAGNKFFVLTYQELKDCTTGLWADLF